MSNDIAESGKNAAPVFRSLRRVAFGRKLFVKVHRYIGLFLGTQFVLVGLTGSILAFWQPIDEWLNADVMRVDVPLQPAYRPLDEILAAAKAAAPPYGMPERLRIPRNSGRAVVVTFIRPLA
jgi:uncharacterized iron-regulated membrane protein